ncbi:protein artichoke [Daktulosphaira vitifoliae]|uniref:protein artichoke n=1 Tax=Daktulosphaira vitifoliae TaxID=58002 RepID=UPI0021AAB8CE|nr:protein artichoke [Daktulosphaira vitifoliae]XP_050530400.1 protein artichoke [Daktulosphaira vitifoliae]XP_050530401.1 protein artichoke [Daktulosphaira vitifoliae]XP_050530402.1 protein artichoke [Daktulosphaira vitifoliae]XP_050530403.1 protein artichoke [Daktulosphaira vitifoliae]
MRSTDGLLVLLWIIIIIAATIITPYANAATCPLTNEAIRRCKCSNQHNEIQIWCSHGDSTTILDELKQLALSITDPVDELILENNAISSIPERAFSTLKIIRLMLRENGLQKIASNWLSDQETSLLELFIVEAELRNFPEESLMLLPRLEALTLITGSLTRLPLISGLARLRYVQIEASSLLNIAPGNFLGLPFLEQLHITGSSKMQKMDMGTIQDLPRLILLNFTDCGLTWLHPRAFARLPALIELSLVGNKLSDTQNIGSAIRDFPSLTTIRLDRNDIEFVNEATFVDIPSLRNIYLSNNLIGDIRRGAFHRMPSLRLIDISNNQLRHIHPESFSPVRDNNLEELLLSKNSIDNAMTIRLILDMFPRLRFLDVSHNQLQDLVYGSIQGHSRLEMLYLEHNKLQRVGRETFSAMPLLRELRLANNSLSNYLATPLWNLPMLKGLDISFNKFDKLDRRMLATLPSLRRFDISHNEVMSMDPTTFIDTPNLEHINISHNHIDSINSLTLTHLYHLYEFDASYNRINQFVGGLPRAIEYLYLSHNKIMNLPSDSSTDLHLPALKLLDVSGNGIHRVPTNSLIALSLLRWLYLGENSIQKLENGAFGGLNQLETLTLNDNKLLSIHANTFKELPLLTELSLKGNRLELLEPSLLSNNPKLKKLNISHNRLTEIYESYFSSNKELEEISIAHNSLSEFPSSLTVNPLLKTLDLRNNEIRHMKSGAVSSMPFLKELYLSENKLNSLNGGAFKQLPNLTILEMEGNNLETLSSYGIQAMPSLIILKMARNKLTSLPSASMVNLPMLQVIELQENQLSEIASDAFVGMPNLIMLNLSHNSLNGMEKSGLNTLRSLEVLDLSHNKLKQIAARSIQNMHSLIMLKLDNNRLCNIIGNPFDGMNRLRVLSLRDNKMTSFSETSFNSLRPTISRLEVDGNPVHCSCNMKWLQSWLRATTEMSGPRCTDGTLLREMTFTSKQCDERELNIPMEHIPGCEIESILVPNTNTSTSNNVQSWVENNMEVTENKPLPEETDYFYDEAVDLEEKPEVQRGFSTEKSVTTISPAILSHFVAGDTPTLYAGTRSNDSNSYIEEQPQSSNSGGNAFTFFGVPIPPLNLNNIWGTMNKGNIKKLKDGRRNSSSKKPLFSMIVDEGTSSGNFTPMLPGIGGFRPMTPSTTADSQDSFGHDNSNVHSVTDYTNLTKIVKITSKYYHNSSTTESPMRQVTVSNNPSNSSILKIYNGTTRDSLFESVAINTIFRPTTNSNLVNSPLQTSTTSSVSQSTVSSTYSENAFKHTTVLSTTYQQQQDQQQINSSTIAAYITPTSNIFFTSSTPTSLTGFLAPGGQLPDKLSGMVVTGKPSIVKVTLSPTTQNHHQQHYQTQQQQQSLITKQPDLTSQNQNLHRFPKSPNNQEAYQSLPTRSSDVFRSTPFRTSLANDWYYANYNKSNVEPYVSRNMDSGGSYANGTVVILMTVIVHLVSFIL